MSYIKLFINVSKKKTKDLGPESQILSPIFKEPLENLFDKPDLIRNNFDSFYNYSLDYYNNLIKQGIKPGEKEINDVINFVVQTDKENETDYYRNLFLLEFLSSKIES